MSDILMKGTEPIGQVADLTADNVEYSSGVSVKQKIDNKVSKTGDTMTGDLIINRNNGTTSSVGESVLALGNNISQGTAGNSKGIIRFFDNLNHKSILAPSNNMTADRFITLPDKSGTIALTSDIIPVVQMGNVTSTSLNNDYDKNYIKMGYLQDSGLPLYGVWGTILCQAGTSGTTRVANQTIVCSNGIAFRHYEGSSWSAWKKRSFS